MSRQCEICGKKSIMVWHLKKLRGKYNPTVKKRKFPNLQWAHLASGKRVKACTKCIRTLSKGKSETRSTKSEIPIPSRILDKVGTISKSQ